MAALYRNREASFTDLRDGLDLTPGNLQSHTSKLEEAGYIKSGRVLVDLSFEVRYRITAAGAAAFQAYLAGLEHLIEAAGDAVRAVEPRHEPSPRPDDLSSG